MMMLMMMVMVCARLKAPYLLIPAMVLLPTCVAQMTAAASLFGCWYKC